MTSSRRLHDCHVIAGLTGNQLPLHAAHSTDIQLLNRIENLVLNNSTDSENLDFACIIYGSGLK